MARIIIDNCVQEIEDGGSILDACEQLGVPFSCEAGECATCVIIVRQGHEHLAPLTPREQVLGLRKGERLACQARILSGTVIATY